QRAFACRALLALSLALLTWTRTGDWQDEYTLFSQAVQTQPQSARAWHILGNAALERGEETRGLTRSMDEGTKDILARLGQGDSKLREIQDSIGQKLRAPGAGLPDLRKLFR
ncbi:MAG: hypothetical protein AAB576_10840, partial [Elusimicrobiota bacterium]